MTRTINEAGLNLIKKWEGFRGEVYKDSVGVLTIGYGHTKNVKPGDTITEPKALELLKEEVAGYAASVHKYLGHVPLNDNQFAALVSLTYNIGAGWMIRKYGLFRLLNDKFYEKAAGRILAYHYAGGKPLQGLKNRRREERELFLKEPEKVVERCTKCGQIIE
ncbi:MAG: lysozyme [Candidatus Marinimicrobia bacterium]|nr:lysozyme [Candidatus Neomarinimicrobiota bacterium]